MSPRRRQIRRMHRPPNFKGYSPYGFHGDAKEPVELLYEEYEAIKLADYELLNHVDACEYMGVSRPTFARIYESARRKIATALSETRPIVTVNHNVEFDDSWFVCNACYSRFNIPQDMSVPYTCPICKSEKIANQASRVVQRPQDMGFCVCSLCGQKQSHQRGVPCRQQICEKCGGKLKKQL